MTDVDLKQAIISYLDGYSIEVTPHDAAKLGEIGEAVPPGTDVYVAHPPGVPVDDVVELAVRLKSLGFAPVPHLIARKVESLAQLESALTTLREHDIDDALVIAGDVAVLNAAFDSSLELLQSGLLAEYGFKRVGVAGHPEGSRAIGEQRVEQALRDKVRFSRDAPFEMRIVTQFGFNPQAVTDWEKRTTEAGIDLPIHVGMAGPASVRQLARFAMLCGIGASANMLMKRTGATANLLKTQAPDGMISHVARHRAQDPSSRIVKAHFFAFGGVAKTARWANEVVAGRFELNSRGTGFDVALPR